METNMNIKENFKVEVPTTGDVKITKSKYGRIFRLSSCIESNESDCPEDDSLNDVDHFEYIMNCLKKQMISEFNDSVNHIREKLFPMAIEKRLHSEIQFYSNKVADELEVKFQEHREYRKKERENFEKSVLDEFVNFCNIIKKALDLGVEDFFIEEDPKNRIAKIVSLKHKESCKISMITYRLFFQGTKNCEPYKGFFKKNSTLNREEIDKTIKEFINKKNIIEFSDFGKMVKGALGA